MYPIFSEMACLVKNRAGKCVDERGGSTEFVLKRDEKIFYFETKVLHFLCILSHKK